MKNRTTVLSVVLFVLAPFVTPLLRAEGAKAPILAQALEDWIAQLETDSVKAPVKYAKDEKAAKLMQEHWQTLQKAHEKHDYRKWLESAQKVDKEGKFVVGGHDYSHLHVEWSKTDEGWKVSSIWFCR